MDFVWNWLQMDFRMFRFTLNFSKWNISIQFNLHTNFNTNLKGKNEAKKALRQCIPDRAYISILTRN